MKRIAFVSTTEAAEWGVNEWLWAETAACLRNQGHEISINVPRWQLTPEPVRVLRTMGCRAHVRRGLDILPRLGPRRRLKLALAGRMPSATPPLPEVDDLWAMGRWLDKVKPDFVVISQRYYLEGYHAQLACMHRKIPFATIVYAAGDYFWPDDNTAVAMAQVYEAATVSCFVSSRVLRFVRRALATPLQNAQIVRYPYFLKCEAVSLPFPPLSEPLRLACVARFDCLQAGQDLLFEVLRAEKWKQRPLRVSLYGSGPNERSLLRLQQEYGLDNVRFCGVTPDVAAIWREHHALILPARHDGLSQAVVEALLCGRPCIVTDVLEVADLIVHGETGFIAEAATPRHLDAALEAAWQARAQWPEMGRCAAIAMRADVAKDPAGELAAEVLRWAGK